MKPFSVTLFAGPTAWGLADSSGLDGVRRLPPVRRGDIDRLVADDPVPGVAIVCDGVFESEPAVGHGELCRAIDAGWQLWGVSSIGAIRAHELRHEGMRGFGWVHAMFDRFDDFTDDEMCLLHLPEEPYLPVSEALVNLRYALLQHGPHLGIDIHAGARAVAALGQLWFGDRTELRMRAAMIEEAGISETRADALLAWLPRHRIKSLDLQLLLSSRPWQA